MAVPLPDETTRKVGPPDVREVMQISRGVVSAIEPEGGLTELQTVMIEANTLAMTGYPANIDGARMTASEFAAVLAPRDAAFRSRIVQMMLLGALVLRPIPPGVTARIAEFADELGVDDGMLQVTQEFADGHLGLAAFDFTRNGYTRDWSDDRQQALHTSKPLALAWDQCVSDPQLAARWQALEDLPPGSLGERVAAFYRARGFRYPGTPDSAPPLLAQHDWVHVLADYGSTVESELEVFAFIARSNDDPSGFSLLAMVVSLFETGYLQREAGLFEASPGRLSSNKKVAIRMADAMRRGALGKDLATASDSIDYMLGVDWFDLAELPVDDVRKRFNVVPKSDHAVSAGSVAPFGAGGISAFQLEHGRQAAVAAGREHDTYGATV